MKQILCNMYKYNMHNGASSRIIYILRTASQDPGLHGCMKISYLTDCEAVWNLFYIKIKYRGARFSCASNLRSGRFPIFPLDIWFHKYCSRSVTYGQADPSHKTSSV
jgi:hypothetical protein